MVAQTIVRQLNAARERLNLVGTLPDEAPQTLDGIRCADVAVHRLQKVVKGEGLLVSAASGWLLHPHCPLWHFWYDF